MIAILWIAIAPFVSCKPWHHRYFMTFFILGCVFIHSFIHSFILSGNHFTKTFIQIHFLNVISFMCDSVYIRRNCHLSITQALLAFFKPLFSSLLLLLLFVQLSFPKSVQEVTICVVREVLMVVDFYFTYYWWSTRDYNLAAQATPSPLIKYYYNINNLNYYIIKFKKWKKSQKWNLFWWL